MTFRLKPYPDWDEASEALADAWASIDGKLKEFRGGKHAPLIELEPGGHYSGYMHEAREMMVRLHVRGFHLVKRTSPDKPIEGDG